MSKRCGRCEKFIKFKGTGYSICFLYDCRVLNDTASSKCKKFKAKKYNRINSKKEEKEIVSNKDLT